MEKVFCDYFETDRFSARMTSTTEFIDSDCLLMMDGVAYHPLHIDVLAAHNGTR